MNRLGRLITSHPVTAALSFSWLVSTSLILGAWFFEFVIELAPCPLCLQQRTGHYLIILLVPISLMFIHKRQRHQYAITLIALLLVLISASWTFSLGAYHAGVEWRFWEGPKTCSNAVDTPLPQTSEALIAALALPDPISCGDIAWSFLGLSLAGYNALFSGLVMSVLTVAFVVYVKSKSLSKPQ